MGARAPCWAMQGRRLTREPPASEPRITPATARPSIHYVLALTRPYMSQGHMPRHMPVGALFTMPSLFTLPSAAAYSCARRGAYVSK
jgi:hypothetical protein